MNYYNNNNYYYYSYYNYLNDSRNLYPQVSRFPYKLLIYISNQTNKRINPGVYKPKRKKRFFIINCYAKFYCSCLKEWTSNLVTVELWWNKRKTEFDVRMYGQKCKDCNSYYLRPQIISDMNEICDKFIEVLTTINNYGIKKNYNSNSNKSNSSHEKEKCQKCEMFGHPCYI